MKRVAGYMRKVPGSRKKMKVKGYMKPGKRKVEQKKNITYKR